VLFLGEYDFWCALDLSTYRRSAEIIEMRFRNGQEATMRYRTNHAGGVIEIQTR